MDADKARELFDYCPESGVLRWKVKRWRVHPGDTCASNGPGGLRVCFEQKSYLVHRVVWLFVYGQWPAGIIDHIDGDCTNNRIANLRDCNQHENQQNRSAYGSKRNKSGHSGINWDSARGAWLVRIRAYGKNYYGGRFASLDEAVEARDRLKASVHTFQPGFRDRSEAA